MLKIFDNDQDWLYGGATAELRGLAGDFGALARTAALLELPGKPAHNERLAVLCYLVIPT